MARPDVTIVVVPRETFSQTRVSLESILEHTEAPYDLVYVDGKPPRRVRDYLDRRSREVGFSVLRTDTYVSPNVARNLGLARVDTPFLAFVDNNAVVTEGWLQRLLACARETDAAFVSPIYCIGSLDAPIVHTAGGEGRVETVEGVRRLVDVHAFCDRPLSSVRHEMRRAPCEVAEFHCVLARTDVARQVGACDPGLPAALEHIDFCLQAHALAGGGWFEPAAVVTYLPPPPLALSDLPYFSLRWSKTWIDASFRHFAAKWDLPPGDPGLRANREWLDKYRWRHLRLVRGGLRRTLGPRAVAACDQVTDRAVSALVRASGHDSNVAASERRLPWTTT